MIKIVRYEHFNLDKGRLMNAIPELSNLKLFVDTQRKIIFRHILTKCAKRKSCSNPKKHLHSAKADRLLRMIWQRKFGKELQKNLPQDVISDYKEYLQLTEEESKTLMRKWKKHGLPKRPKVK